MDFIIDAVGWINGKVGGNPWSGFVTMAGIGVVALGLFWWYASDRYAERHPGGPQNPNGGSGRKNFADDAPQTSPSPSPSPSPTPPDKLVQRAVVGSSAGPNLGTATKPVSGSKTKEASPVVDLRGGTIQDREQSVNIRQGAGSIAQVGDNNTATINPDVNPNAPVVTYEFNGIKHTQLGGSHSGEAGEQFEKFHQMMNLWKAGKWEEMLREANGQIDAAPGWLTAYLFKAKALAEIGHKDEAIKLCEYVKSKSGGNESFDDRANDLLKEFGQPPKQP